MDWLFGKSFDAISEADLKDIVEIRRVREHVSLDYKRDPYPHGHNGAVDMLVDITAMANSRGGYIVIGVEEDDNEPDGTPKRLVGIENADIEANWIQSVCLSAIDERISDLRVREIPLANELQCIIIQIPNSLRKPHMVVHEKHRSFNMRHGRNNSRIGMQEVRSLILSMNSYQAPLKEFINSRVDEILSTALSKPFLLLMSTPIYIREDHLDPLRSEIRKLIEETPGVPDTTYEGIRVGKTKPRIFGIEALPYIPSDGSISRRLRLLRNGHFEYYENYSSDAGPNWPTEAMPIYSYRIAVTLLHFLRVSQHIYLMSETPGPYVISMVLGNTAPSILHPRIKYHYFPDEVFVWHESVLHIDTSVNDLGQLNAIASDLLDRLFNAYGHEQNVHFGHDYQLIKQ